MGQTITVLREQRGMARDTFAAKIEKDRPTLEKIERGEVNADWGTLRAVARVLCLPLDVLIELAEECAPGAGGEEWRRWTREVVQERAAKEVG
jgi:DNA-binding XRE family transcriptional regulator